MLWQLVDLVQKTAPSPDVGANAAAPRSPPPGLHQCCPTAQCVSTAAMQSQERGFTALFQRLAWRVSLAQGLEGAADVQSLQLLEVGAFSAGFRAARRKETRKIQGNPIFLHLPALTCSSGLQCTHCISTSVEQPAAAARGRTQEGNYYIGALSQLQLCSDQPWTGPSAQLLSQSPSCPWLCPTSCRGSGQEQGVLLAPGGDPRGQGGDNHPL